MSGTNASIIESQQEIIADQGQTIKDLSEALDKEKDEAIEMLRKLVAYEKRDKEQEDMIEHLKKVRNSLMDKLAEYEPEQDRYAMAKKSEEERRKMMIAAEISQMKAGLKGPLPPSPRTKRFHEALEQAKKRNKKRDQEERERMRERMMKDAKIAQMKASGNFEKYKANVKF